MARRFILAAALAALVPAAAHAQSPATAGARVDAHAEATRLAALLIPDELYDRLMAPIFDALMMKEIEQDAAWRAVAESRPEILSEFREKLVPVIVAILREEMPGYRADVRDLILKHASPEEIRTLADFFGSPTGRKFYGTVMNMIAANGGDRPDDKAVERMIGDMSPTELAELDRLGRNPAMAKFGEITVGLGPISDRWSQRLIEKHGKRIEAAVHAALEPLLKTPRKK